MGAFRPLMLRSYRNEEDQGGRPENSDEAKTPSAQARLSILMRSGNETGRAGFFINLIEQGSCCDLKALRMALFSSGIEQLDLDVDQLKRLRRERAMRRILQRVFCLSVLCNRTRDYPSTIREVLQ